MNGIKAPTPDNSDTKFDTWAIWSDMQKQELIKDIGVPKEQLLVTGHLMSDVAANYEYQGTYDIILRKWSDKHIIAIFSQPQDLSGDYRSRFFKSAIRYIQERPDLVGIIKPHPRESSDEIIKQYGNNERVIVLQNNKQNPTVQLYDLLYISKLTLVMFSTVAIESLFLRTPVISLNYTGIPGLLPIVNYDNDWVVEATDYSSFVNTADEILSDQKQTYKANTLKPLIGPVDGKVAKRVAKILCNSPKSTKITSN